MGKCQHLDLKTLHSFPLLTGLLQKLHPEACSDLYRSPRVKSQQGELYMGNRSQVQPLLGRQWGMVQQQRPDGPGYRPWGCHTSRAAQCEGQAPKCHSMRGEGSSGWKEGLSTHQLSPKDSSWQPAPPGTSKAFPG